MDTNKLLIARIDQQLNKIANFSGIGILSFKDYFKNYVVRVEEIKTNNQDKYNRVKFNRMDNQEQFDYENFLNREVVKFRAYNKNGTFIEINKLLFEGFKGLNDGITLNLKEV